MTSSRQNHAECRGTQHRSAAPALARLSEVLRRRALDGPLLGAGDPAVLAQPDAEARDAAHEGAMAIRTHRAGGHEIRDRRPVLEQEVLHA